MSSFFTRRLILTLATILVAGGLAAAWQLGRIALRPVAMYTGWLLLGLLLGLTFFNARKKLPFIPLLSASHWLQAHIYLGWLACFVFLLHTGGRWPAGTIEIILALAFGLVAASGAFGLWLSRWCTRMTRTRMNPCTAPAPKGLHEIRKPLCATGAPPGSTICSAGRTPERCCALPTNLPKPPLCTAIPAGPCRFA